jgi:hypothetical protein
VSTLAAGARRDIPSDRAEPNVTDAGDAAAAPQQVFVDQRGIRRRVLAVATLLTQIGLILVASVVVVAVATSIVSGPGPVELGADAPAPQSPVIDDARPAAVDGPATNDSGGVNLVLLIAIGLFVGGALLILFDNLPGRLEKRLGESKR